MKKHICCSLVSASTSFDEQICSLTKQGSRCIESFVTGEKFEFNHVYDEMDDYIDFYDTILKPASEKFINGSNGNSFCF